MPDTPMTATERREFAAFLRLYVDSIKARGESHAAQLALACEEELSRTYRERDVRWRDATTAVREQVAAANEAIRAAFAAQGFTNTDRMPELNVFWLERGETGSRERRAELRKVAEAQAKLVAKAAVAKAKELSLEVQQQLLVEQLSYDAALALVRALPTERELMPPLNPRQIERIARREGSRPYLWHQQNLPELMDGRRRRRPRASD